MHMADVMMAEKLKQGTFEWNDWRRLNPEITNPDLSGVKIADLHFGGSNLVGADLSRAHFKNVNLQFADLSGSNLLQAFFENVNFQYANVSRSNLYRTIFNDCTLSKANLSQSNLNEAYLVNAFLGQADLSQANLQRANLTFANLSEANLSEANLRNAKLERSVFVETNVDRAILSNSSIYGISAWDLKGSPAEQLNLVITQFPQGDIVPPKITVDDIQIAQFIYLMLNNKNIRNVIDSITSKAVLILGRFSLERKAVLDAIQTALRQRNYLPILFDFEGPINRDITETVSTLAHMARFVVADITDAKSIPQELQAIVPNLPSVPVQPLILASQREYGMFEHFKRYPWVLETYLYEDEASLIYSLQENVIQPAETYLASQKR